MLTSAAGEVVRLVVVRVLVLLLVLLVLGILERRRVALEPETRHVVVRRFRETSGQDNSGNANSPIFFCWGGGGKADSTNLPGWGTK